MKLYKVFTFILLVPQFVSNSPNENHGKHKNHKKLKGDAVNISDIEVNDSDIKFQISIDRSSLQKQNKGEIW
jgi:hypothetical protein